MYQLSTKAQSDIEWNIITNQISMFFGHYICITLQAYLCLLVGHIFLIHLIHSVLRTMRLHLDLRILCCEQRMRLFLLVYFRIILSRFQSTEKSDNQKYPPFFIVIYFTIPWRNKDFFHYSFKEFKTIV